MGKHLVLTVHGVGEQKPSETVDQVVGAATTWVDGKRKPAVVVKRSMIELAENHFNGSSRNAQLFPVHLRHVTEPGNDEDVALFAEVFWADRSPAPKGVINTIFDLIWVVLALGYLAMDNVEQTHRRKGVAAGAAGERDTVPARIVHLFTWFFFGGLATLNVYLLLGSAFAFLDQLFPAEKWGTTKELYQFLGLFALYGGFVWMGLARWHKAPTYLRRVFWRGISIVGGALLFLLVTGPQFMGLWHIGLFVPQEALSAMSEAEKDPMAQFVGVQIAVLGVFWAVQCLLSVLMLVTSTTAPDIGDKIAGHRRLYPAICAGMMVLWMFFISGLWLSYEKIVSSVPALQNSEMRSLLDVHLIEAINSVSVVFVAVVLLCVVGVALFILRKVHAYELYKQGDGLRRAILNRWAQRVFWLSAIVLAAMAARAILTVVLKVDPLCSVDLVTEATSCNWLGRRMEWLARHEGQIGLFVVGAIALLYRFSGFVAAGLGVARDIVTYAIRDRCALDWDLAARKKNYPPRDAIEERFFRTLYYATQVFTPDKITVISHSQGTVVATRMLADPRVQKRIAGKPVTLVTMGSPVTHIYQTYFPELFTVDPAALNARWFNIFRHDDFVGTKIDGGLIAEDCNIPVSPGGHSGYFTDYEVWKALSGPKIRFALFGDWKEDAAANANSEASAPFS
ncbi:hypothetical protein [Shimia sp. MMG029]|uniref:hypothetical protein n=1 Tax=Shimia sp. MMG029 TaxID=3021978 RepID=UPI0022FDE78F|nr:hypothetical protein [Shimia sp. MMG029]MDA5557471.1 hypothetical protein [Shimia sp. MMG029]